MLAKGKKTPELNGTTVLPKIFDLGVKASSKIFSGAIVCTDATGYAVKGSEAAGLTARGVAQATADNTSGASGDIKVRTFAGVFKLKNSSSGEALTITEVGKLCYIADDETVSKTSNGGARSVAGLVVQVDTDGVWVLIGALRANLAALVTQQATFSKPAADGAANTATAETVFFRAPVACRVLAAFFAPSAALVGDATNNAVLTVKTRDGAGGTASTVAALTTTASWTAFVPASLGAITNGVLAAGALLTLTIAKGGTGVAVPSGVLVVLYEPA